MIEWRQMNLAGKWPYMSPFDVIFMRNVLIYFSPSTSESILKQARNQLQPNGALFLGTTENTLGLNTGLESVTFGKTIYYRRATGRP
jgi:chemotaxis protein methyltransferase CheR